MNENLVKTPKQTISGKTIYLVVTAAGKIEKIVEMVDELSAQGCDVHIFPTEKAINLIEPLEKFSDKIHGDFNWYGPRKSIPEEDIVIVAPCTFNSFNKIALGIADNYPTTLVATAIRKLGYSDLPEKGIRIVVKMCDGFGLVLCHRPF